MHLGGLHRQHIFIVMLMQLQSGSDVALLRFLPFSVCTKGHPQTYMNMQVKGDMTAVYLSTKVVTCNCNVKELFHFNLILALNLVLFV